MKFEEYRNTKLNENAEDNDSLFKKHLANAHPSKIKSYTDNTRTHLEMAKRIADTPEKVSKVHAAAKVIHTLASKKADEGDDSDGPSSIHHHGVVHSVLRHARIGVLDHDTAKHLINHHMDAAHKIMQKPEHNSKNHWYVDGQVEQHKNLRDAVDKFHKRNP